MPNKLTDAEIVKGLENEIHLAQYVDSDYCSNTEVSLLKFTLDLIDRLQAENEELTQKYAWEHNEYMNYRKKHSLLKSLVKAEAYEEFAYDLMQIPRSTVFKNEIENLLKEKLGEKTPLNDVKCIDCEYLEFELPYAVCSKAHKGIVSPNDSCGKGKLKEKVGNDAN